jgi:hypothetical protein
MRKLLNWPATFNLKKLFTWLDAHLLEIGIIILSIFIPLYPKLPLIDIPHTWVYVRVEDFLVALVVGIWLIQLARGKVSLATPLTFPIFAYWLVGGISLAYAVFILAPHLANFFPNIAFLHYFRRIEYMVLFFIAASTVKDLRVVKRYIFFIALTFFGVCLYGFGQKFLGFPAFLTMNEEFAKGIPLYLPPTARMTSTFAGHYDLAAWLVLMIAFFGSLIFGFKNILAKLGIFLLTFLGFILLLFTASRISFMVYLVAISFMLFLQKKKWLIIPVILASLFLMNYVTASSQRFGKTFRVERVVYDVRTGEPIVAVEEPLAEEPEEELPLGTGFLALPIIETTPEATQVAVIRKSLRTATMSAEIATISGEFLIKRAIVYDISFTTRFQGTWPRAYKAFQRSPILGTGYSSISLATDNSYLRALGETGLLGLFAFLSLLFALGLLARQGLARITSPFSRSILIGMTAGVLGLMLNAILIDVFEASKVAYGFWILLGITVGLIQLVFPKRRSLIKEAAEVAKSPLTTICTFCFLTPLIFWSAFKNYFVGDDFTWLKWAVTSKINDIPQFFLSAQGFFYRPLAKIYFLLAHPFFDLRPYGYHVVDILVHLGCAIGVYLVILLITKKKFVSSFASLLFLIHPVNAESVFWISSTSALFASLFYLWGFLFYVQWRASQRKWRHLFFLLTLLAFILGLVSHERMITFPLVLLLYDFVFKKFEKSKRWAGRIALHLPFWALTSVYLWLRNVIAQAHGLSGDYNYNLGNLVFNFAGNLFGYIGELIASFHFIPFYDLARLSLRSHNFIALGLLIVGLLLIKKLRERLKLTRLIVFSIGWFIILLLPFLGLGNIAERHVYPAHLGFFILIALLINWIYERLKKQNYILSLCLIALIIAGLLGFYQQELEKAKQNWYQAGEIANKILLALSSNYAEFPLDSTLYFVNLPIRQNRAWVFPVGIEDGIWFIYRDESLTINRTTDLEETLDLAEGKPNAYVFLYEEGELKEVRK